MSLGNELLYDFWYLAAPGRSLRKGRTRGRVMLGQGVLIGRDAVGAVFALRDFCPHRGVPLSYGKFDGREIQCCFHGWRFDCTGTCTKIPSLLPTQTFRIDRVKTGRFPCREVEGNIWVYIPRPGNEPPADADLPAVPSTPEMGNGIYRLAAKTIYPCTMDQAAISLVDPAHVSYVHRSWWWRGGTSVKIKEKRFEPSPLGFDMVWHEPSANSKGYRLFGKNMMTEIRFQLPGLRVESIKVGGGQICTLMALTPIGPNETELNLFFYWTSRWITPFFPLFRKFARTFLEQDRAILDKQRQGLNGDPDLMLINDADRPTRWYLQLKKEMVAARNEGRPFQNPIQPTVLRWQT